MRKQKEESFTGNPIKKAIPNVLNDVNLLNTQKVNVQELVKTINKVITNMHSSVEDIFSVQSSIQNRKIDVDNHINELFVSKQVEKFKELNGKKDT
jgi:hypothetical protein